MERQRPFQTVQLYTKNSNKKMKVLVQLIEGTTVPLEFVKSKDIICPQCFEPCRIKTENFRIILFGCINNHITNIKIKDFFDSQKINITNIICGKCKLKNKADSHNNEFYKCLTCNIDLCLLCKSVHQSEHYIINYEQKNYICNKHNDSLLNTVFDVIKMYVILAMMNNKKKEMHYSLN